MVKLALYRRLLGVRIPHLLPITGVWVMKLLMTVHTQQIALVKFFQQFFSIFSFTFYKNLLEYLNNFIIMTYKEIKAARKDVQKLIKENKKQLLLQIKKKHPKLIRLIKKNYDVNSNSLLDDGFYEQIEDCLS